MFCSTFVTPQGPGDHKYVLPWSEGSENMEIWKYGNMSEGDEIISSIQYLRLKLIVNVNSDVLLYVNTVI
jgi:hypothetical protein